MEQDILKAIDPTEYDKLGNKLMSEFKEAEEAKKEWYEIAIRAHENVNGVYPKSMNFSGTSRAFARITRPRVMHAVARIMEVLAPIGGDLVTFDPTPYPHMPVLELQLKAQGADQFTVEKAVKMAADVAAQNFTVKAKDALEEMRFRRTLKNFIHNMCEYGAGILMGPEGVSFNATDSNSWRAQGFSGGVRPEFRSISPLQWIPAPGSTTIEDMPYAYVREVVDKNILMDWSKDDVKFNVDTIKELLKTKSTGDWQPVDWETRILGANKMENAGPYNKFIVLIRWGFISGSDLRDAGYPIDDDQMNEQVMAQVWLCGGRVIAIRPAKLFRDRLPFYVGTYSHKSNSIMGCGVAECMFDSQDAYNACERAKYDNLARSAGPYAEVIVDRLDDPGDSSKIGPNCVIKTKESEYKGGDGRAVHYQIVPNITEVLERTQANIMLLIQDQTGLPNVLIGQGGEGVHNRTSSGASMQYNSAITPLKGVIMGLEEDVLVPALTKLKEFYDMFSDDDTIKGDMKVIARGVSGLMAREALNANLNDMLQIMAQNPEWAAQVDMNRVGQIKFRLSGLADQRLTYTPAEVEANKQKQMEEEQNRQTMKAQGQMQIEMEAQRLRAMTSPSDALLQVAEQSPEGSAVSYMAMRDALELLGALKPDLRDALETSAKVKAYQTGIEAAQAADLTIQSQESTEGKV